MGEPVGNGRLPGGWDGRTCWKWKAARRVGWANLLKAEGFLEGEGDKPAGKGVFPGGRQGTKPLGTEGFKRGRHGVEGAGAARHGARGKGRGCTWRQTRGVGRKGKAGVFGGAG